MSKGSSRVKRARPSCIITIPKGLKQGTELKQGGTVLVSGVPFQFMAGRGGFTLERIHNGKEGSHV